eukprot:290398-Chlamydomonas_euryale.AAC.1
MASTPAQGRHPHLASPPLTICNQGRHPHLREAFRLQQRQPQAGAAGHAGGARLNVRRHEALC